MVLIMSWAVKKTMIVIFGINIAAKGALDR